MQQEFDLEGVVVQILATALAMGFYGAMLIALFRVAAGA